MSLGVDLDNVLAETDAAVRAVLSRTLQRPVSREEITEFSYAASLGIDPSYESSALEQFHSFLCMELQPVPDSQDALRRLSSLAHIDILTSRPRSTEVATRAWLDDRFAGNYTLTFCEPRSKLEVCQEKGITVLVEDKGETALEAKGHGILTILLDYPWNKRVPSDDGIIRASDWSKIYRIVVGDARLQEMLKPELARLVEGAALVSNRAHSPYSEFNVGAVLKAKDGKEIAGCNVESASYGLTCCAERVALFKAVSEGYCPGDLVAIGIAARLKGGTWKFATPCGACRQLLTEFSSLAFPMVVAIRTDEGQLKINTVDHYLPEPFHLDAQS